MVLNKCHPGLFFCHINEPNIYSRWKPHNLKKVWKVCHFFCLFLFRLAVGHKYHTVFCRTISRRKLHMDRKTSFWDTTLKVKATKKRGRTKAGPKGSYKAEADILTRQEEPIDKVNTEKRLRSWIIFHRLPAGGLPAFPRSRRQSEHIFDKIKIWGCLKTFLIRLNLELFTWQLTHGVQQKEAPTSPTVLRILSFYQLYK